MQLLVGVRPALANRFAFPDDSGLVLPIRGQVAIQAVIGQVYLATLKPLDIPFYEVIFPYLIPLLDPVQLLSHLSPEPFRVLYGALIYLLVLSHAFDVGPLAQLTWRSKLPFLIHYVAVSLGFRFLINGVCHMVSLSSF